MYSQNVLKKNTCYTCVFVNLTVNIALPYNVHTCRYRYIVIQNKLSYLKIIKMKFSFTESSINKRL